MTMTPIYIAESSLDAQLVQDLLVGTGITAHVLSPNVATEPGEPGSGKYRVVVEDAEVAAARELIQEWDTGPAPDEEDFDLLDSLPLQTGTG